MNLSPGNAAFLSVLVPGLPHFLQQKPVRGIVALLSCAGLFFAGYSMLGDRLWNFVWFPPFDMIKPVFNAFPLNLWPEWPNLGCSMLASFLQESHSDVMVQSNVLRLRRVPVDGEHLAFFLTSASGIVSVLWAADAYFVSQQRQALESNKPIVPRQNPSLMALWSWLLPGSGHWQLGQRDKGVLIGGAVIALYAMAMLFSHGHAIDRVDSPAYWIGQVLFGGGALFASLVTAPMELQKPLPLTIDLGITLALVAGVMNMVVIIDAYTVAERSGRPAPEADEDEVSAEAKPGGVA